MGLWEVARIVAFALNPFLGAPLSRLPPLPPPTPSAPIGATSSSTSPASMSTSLVDECEAPVWYSAEGIKHYVIKCLSVNPPANDPMVPDCTLPFEVDAEGHRHYLTQCLDSVESECAVPFTFEGDVKKYKVNCL